MPDEAKDMVGKYPYPLKHGEPKEPIVFEFAKKGQTFLYHSVHYNAKNHKFTVWPGQWKMANWLHDYFVKTGKAIVAGGKATIKHIKDDFDVAAANKAELYKFLLKRDSRYAGDMPVEQMRKDAQAYLDE